MGLPDATSHNRAVLSQDPVAIVLPSGLNATRRHSRTVGEDLLHIGVAPSPGRQVVQRDMPGGRVSRLGCHLQRFESPHHSEADLILLEGGLTALEVKPR